MNGDVTGGVIDAGEYRALDQFSSCWRSLHGPVVWDVGANVGDYAQAVRRRFPNAQLWGFEPQAGAYETLAGLLGDRALNIGLSSEFRLAKLHKTSHPACYLASLFPRSSEVIGADVSSIEEARFHTGEQVMESAGVDYIDWLKIDTEGHEVEVLEGFGDKLFHFVGVVQAEYNGAAVEQGIPFLDLWNALSPVFSIYRLDEDGTVTFVPEYDEAQEGAGQRNYIGINADCDWFAFSGVGHAAPAQAERIADNRRVASIGQ